MTNFSKSNDKRLAEIESYIKQRQNLLQQKIDEINEEEDLCTNEHDCTGSLGFDRVDMPQINNEEDLDILEEFVESIPGYTINEEVFKFDKDIKPIQMHVSGTRTAKICNAQLKDGARSGGVPVILVRGNTPNDVFILDGHHRGFASAQCGVVPKLRVLVIENKNMSSNEAANDIMQKLQSDSLTREKLFKGFEI